jgi:hypothetical protein
MIRHMSLATIILLTWVAVSAADSRIIARDGMFVSYANGVVADMQNGMEWFAGPDVDTSYYQAVEWVRELTVAGGGWRMPTAKELDALYREPGKPASITPLLKTRGIHIWPYQDNEDLSLYLFRYMDPYGTRGFAVRRAVGQTDRQQAQPGNASR